MRVFFWYLILFLLSYSAKSQNNGPATDTTANPLKNERWGLQKYLWSFAHCNTGKSDKKSIDFDAVDDWQGLGQYLSVSNDGKYFAYTVERGIGFTKEYRKLDSLVVQSTTNSWQRSFPADKPGFFSDDNKQYIFQDKSTLCWLQLGSGKCKVINDVESYLTSGTRKDWIVYKLKNENSIVLQNLVTENVKKVSNVAAYSFDKSNQWVSCEMNSSLKELLIYNLDSGKQQTFSSVTSYLFSTRGNALLINCGNELKYFNCGDQTIETIWTATDTSKILGAYQFDESGAQVVFTVKEVSSAKSLNSIWYYKQGMDKALIKINDETSGITGGLKLQESASFTDNDRYIHLTLKRDGETLQTMNDAVQLDIWSYKDLNLQSAQTILAKQSKLCNAFIGVDNDQLIIVEKGEDNAYLIHGDFAIVKKSDKSTHGDRFWEKGYGYNEDSNWVVSLKDGSRRLLPTTTNWTFGFSPDGNYLVYFDASKGCHYFSYNLSTGRVNDISANLPAGQLGVVDGYPNTLSDQKPEFPFGPAAWIQDDAGILVYDNNDVWRLDLSGKKPAVNITCGFGRSHGIVFSLINSHRVLSEIPIVSVQESLLLRAFNSKNKYNGFYRKNVSGIGDLELLTMGPYFMHLIPWNQDPNLSKEGLPPVKARDVDVWIVQRQSSTDAPNYYETIDFKAFRRLTNLQPQKKYNWLSEELHSFKHLDGRIGKAILYKPENFDSSRKYPVLIILYGGYSNNLHQFPIPTYNDEAITPGEAPNWMLNNGYLIFTPDIYVAPFKYGPEAFNVIEGAARYLKQLPYIDSNKLGYCAHSWSAKLGSYIFTHSKSFAAIGISEGFLYANMINEAFSTDDNENSRLETVEMGFKFGNLWKYKDLWLEHTTVLNVDKAKSPLLLLCNKQSSKEYQDQTFQLFSALRRLDKKVWWLKYDKGGHRLTDLNERKDFTIRYTQFFDHYLKEAPAPRWMTQGIPHALKGIESKYELDPVGSCGKDCKICKKWNEQYKKHSEMFVMPISEWHL